MRRALLAVGLCLSVGWGAAAFTVTTTADLKAMLDGGEYQRAILASNDLLKSAPVAPAAVDRGEVLALKGEAQLQVKAFGAAAESFAEAAREQRDARVAATDKAMEILIRRSSGGVYAAKYASEGEGASGSINILDRSNRRVVLGNLFHDEFVAAQPNLDAARTAQTFEAMRPAMDQISMLEQLEFAVAGKSEQTNKVIGPLSDHAYLVMSVAVKSMEGRVEDIHKSAYASVWYTDPVPTIRTPTGLRGARHLRKVGLSATNVAELKGMIASARGIEEAAETFAKTVSGRARWELFKGDGDRIIGRAQDLLEVDFANGTANSPGQGR